MTINVRMYAANIVDQTIDLPDGATAGDVLQAFSPHILQPEHIDQWSMWRSDVQLSVSDLVSDGDVICITQFAGPAPTPNAAMEEKIIDALGGDLETDQMINITDQLAKSAWEQVKAGNWVVSEDDLEGGAEITVTITHNIKVWLSEEELEYIESLSN